MSREIAAFGGVGSVIARHNARKGHATSVKNTARTVVTSTKADDIKAKPAPGPMYAEAGATPASTTATVATATRQYETRPPRGRSDFRTSRQLVFTVGNHSRRAELISQRTMTLGSFLRRLRRGRPITVVSGLPRSGTSMAMKMLEEGGLQVVTDGVRGADASNPQGYYEYEPVKTLSTNGDTAWLGDARGKAVKIISFLLTYLPESYDYTVVFMRRDLDEIIASQNAMLDARGAARGAGDDRTRAHYAQHLEQVERFLARRSCFSTLMLNYTDVLASPRDEASRINAFVGGRLDVERMARVADLALYRSRSEAPRSRG
jgi:hypothetical protein